MPEKGYVYGLLCSHCEDTEFRYIGQTIQNPSRRFNNHKYYARISDQLPVYRWIAKHGEENIRQVVIEEVDRSELDAREIFHIAQAKLNNTKPLLNLCDGGQGASGITEENRKARSDRLRGTSFFEGRKHTEESKEKMRNAKLGKKHSPEHRAKISASRKGQKLSAEQIKFMSESQKGRVNIGVHNRWHKARNITNPECIHCTTANVVL